MTYRTAHLDELVEDPHNARLHDMANLTAIRASLLRFGQVEPLVVRSGTQQVVGGNGRLQVMRALGWETAEIREVDLSDDEAIALGLALNRTAELATWDETMLRTHLKTLSDAQFDVGGFSLDEKELKNLNFGVEEKPEAAGKTDPDEVPEAPKDPITKPGDLWILGNHRLLCGDSTNIQHVERLMDGKKADMVFTDPPYGIGLDKQGQKLGKSQAYRAVLNDHDATVAIDAYALVKDFTGGPLFFWGANHYSQALPSSPCWIVWDKQGGKHVTYADVELCFSDLKAPARLFTHIWDGFRRDSEKGEKRVHPTQKPVNLIVEIWEFFSEHIHGPLVLDLFGGSGSTLIACEKTSRHCRMMELDPAYCDVIVKRWEDFTGQKAVRA